MVQCIAPAPAVHVAPAPAVHVAPSLAVFALPAPMNENVAPAPDLNLASILEPPVPIIQVVQASQVQVIVKIVESLEIQSVQDTQTSESLGPAPSRRVDCAETVEGVEIGLPLPAEPSSPMHVTTPVPAEAYAVEALVDEYNFPALAVSYASLVPMVEHSALAPAVSYAAQAPVFIEKIVETPEIHDVVEFEPPLPAECCPPMRETTPVVEAPLVLIEHVLPAALDELVAPAASAPIAENVAPAPVVSYTVPTLVVGYNAPTPAVFHDEQAPLGNFNCLAPAATYAAAPVVKYVASAPSVEATLSVSHERIQHHTMEQIVDIPVPGVHTSTFQERIPEFDSPVPQIMEALPGVHTSTPQKQSQMTVISKLVPANHLPKSNVPEAKYSILPSCLLGKTASHVSLTSHW